MRLAAGVLSRLRNVLRRGREDHETVVEELRFHLAMETEKNLRAGMDPGEARRQARLRLGGVDAIREAVRDARGRRPLEHLVRDLGYALRAARRNPGFTLVAALTLTPGDKREHRRLHRRGQPGCGRPLRARDRTPRPAAFPAVPAGTGSLGPRRRKRLDHGGRGRA